MLVKKIKIPQNKITEFCQRWQVKELALFGSVLREDFKPDSDIDLLVTFAENHQWSLFDFVDMQDRLEEILGKKVDLVSKHGIEKSRNYIRRQNILNSTEVFIKPRNLSSSYTKL